MIRSVRGGARRVVLATRGSALALAQAELVKVALEGEGASVELRVVKTGGDTGARPAGDKSRWVDEIERALLAGHADLAVHSAKDVPGELAEGLAIVGVPPRADARDVLIGAADVGSLPDGARIGTSSLRRRSQLLSLRPGLAVGELRGNVDTRLRKAGEWDAIVLARAGLERLGHDEGVPIAVEELVPAPGQGCLALEARSDDSAVRELASAVTHPESLMRLSAERATVERLGATCHTPVGAHAVLEAGSLTLTAWAGRADGSQWIRDSLSGEEPVELGRAVGERMLAAGAAEVLAG